MKILWVAVSGLLFFAPAAAQAETCPSSNICASRPQGIIDSLQMLGYKAVLEKADDGRPKISSAASGYKFDIHFYDCKENVDCSSLQFRIWFNKEAYFSPDLANKWNLNKRFVTMAYDPKDSMMTLSYDVSTDGGLNQVQFADTIDWWDTMLGEFDKFTSENKPKAKVRK